DHIQTVTQCLWCVVCIVHSSGTLSHVERYEVVRPQRLQERHRRSLQDHPQLAIEGRNHTILLEKNRNLIGRDYTETHYTEDGKRVTTSPKQDHCYYHGHIEGMDDSSVSVGICSGMSGFLRARQQVYLIEPLGQTDDGDHAVYRQEHLKISGRPSCGYSSNTTLLYDQDQGPQVAGLFRSRSWKSNPTPGPQRFVELYVVVDNAEYKKYGSNTESRILGVVNHIDKLYRRLNIRVLLVGLEIWSNKDLIDVSHSSEATLDKFLAWRLTFVDFDGETVGLANKFAMCTGNSGGVNQDHHENPIGLASTIAHEMGHNFGLSHDPRSPCSSHRAGNQMFPELFSSCSLSQLAEFLERAQPSCLQKPTSSRIIAVGPRCGNGMMEPGEECDCGTVEECNNPCCDASTCRLTAGSQCAHGQCCEKCQLKSSGSVCRQSAGTCDLPEFCTGLSSDCPEDSFEMNGKPCYKTLQGSGTVQGYCYNGQCPTQEHHCWRLFGPGAQVAPDLCFNLNQSTTKLWINAFVLCRDVKCGSMFCEEGGESITGKRASYNTMYGKECKLAVDDDKRRNLDMVPSGTKCAPDKVKLCVDVSAYGKREDCAKKCNNNGVCNHRNECHCNPGWAPPKCNVQYADLPQDQVGLIAGVCAAVSILLVVTLLIAGLMCCKKDDMERYIATRKVHSAEGKLNPSFQEGSGKERPQISQPTFMETTAKQACTPLMGRVTPCRPAPQVRRAARCTQVSSSSFSPQMKPLPPSKPLPTLNKTQVSAKAENFKHFSPGRHIKVTRFIYFH
uniref:ADAM metallopeptidase domain 8b n=1 Tax=Astatotilapia calliptera TaxID=8154 RepID=A0A3P8QWM7_ASTCA